MVRPPPFFFYYISQNLLSLNQSLLGNNQERLLVSSLLNQSLASWLRERRGGGGIKQQINNPKHNLKEAQTGIMEAVAVKCYSHLNVSIRPWMYRPAADADVYRRQYNQCKVMQSSGSLYHKSSSLALSANITNSPDWLTASVRFPAIMSSPFSFHSALHMWVIRLEAVGVSPSS